jgi:hypothetical protein
VHQSVTKKGEGRRFRFEDTATSEVPSSVYLRNHVQYGKLYMLRYTKVDPKEDFRHHVLLLKYMVINGDKSAVVWDPDYGTRAEIENYKKIFEVKSVSLRQLFFQIRYGSKVKIKKLFFMFGVYRNTLGACVGLCLKEMRRMVKKNDEYFRYSQVTEVKFNK